MSPVVACTIYLAFLLPVVAAGVWCWHRYSAPLLLDAVDADEMFVGAVHRWTTVTYAMLALGFAVSQTPDRHDVAAGIGSAVVGHWAWVVTWLGVAQGVALWLLLRHRRTRQEAELSTQVWGPLPPWAPPGPAAPPVACRRPVDLEAPAFAGAGLAGPGFAGPGFAGPGFAESGFPAPAFPAPAFPAPPYSALSPGYVAPMNLVGNPYAWPPPNQAPRRR